MENLPAAGNTAAPPGPQLSPGVIFKQLMQQRESALAEKQQDSSSAPSHHDNGGLLPPPDGAAANLPANGHRTGLPLTPRDVEKQQQQQQQAPPMSSSSPCPPLQPIQGAANSLSVFPISTASPQPRPAVPQQLTPLKQEDRPVPVMDLRSPSPKPPPHQAPAGIVALETVDLTTISSDDDQQAAVLVGAKRKDPEELAVMFVSHIPAPQQQHCSTAHHATGGAPLPHPYSHPGAPGYAAPDLVQQQQQQQQLLQQPPLNPQPQGAAAAAAAGPGAMPAAPLPLSSSSTAESKRALRAVAEALTSTSAVEKEPPYGALRCSTMPHQRLALGWMCKREEGCIPVGGILADDQGLGKTVSTISLIVTRPPNRSRPPGAAANGKSSPDPPVAAAAAAEGAPEAPKAPEQGTAGAIAVQEALEEEVLNLFTADSDSDEMDVVEVTDECVQQGRRPEAGTLVVCPTAVLNQWATEIEDKVDSAAGLTVTVYHGKDKIRDPEVLSRMGVVLTTYTTMALEAPAKIRQKGKQAAMSPSELRNRAEEGGPLFRCYWHRVVLDEGHSIKNSRTVVAKAAWHLAARNRWILTGTPLQNSVDDLYSYFRFLRYTPYTDHAAFKRQIKDPISQRPAVGYKRLNAVLKGVMLRRTKSTTIDGKPVVDLPPCTHKLVRKQFTPQEQQLYNKIHSECTNKFNAMKAAGGGKTSYVNMLLMLLRLRQACNHPGLVKDSTGSMVALHPPTAAQVSAARGLPESLRKELMAAGLECASQCPICDDIPEDTVVSVCKHVFCRTCIVTKMQEPEWEDRPLCPCCSAVLKDEASLHSPAALMEAETGGQGAVPGAPPLHMSSVPPLPEDSNAISSAKVEQLMEILKKIRESQAPSEAPSSSVQYRARLPSLGRGKKDKRMAAAFGRISKTAAASHAPQAAPKQKSPTPLASGSPPPGCKIPDKVLVFSQWTSMLDLLEGPLREAGIQFRRLDGTMSVAQRQDAVTDFKNNRNVFVLIASLKAAAVGLNLVAANYVILLDLWWNPTIEQQAIDRAHRIGQTREVEVVRITIEGTVEDRILSLQGKKREIVDAALMDEGSAGGQGDRHSASRLSQHDLEYLFLGNHS